jgi:hypothetical protein
MEEQPVQTVAAFIARTRQPGVLRFVLGHDQRLAIAGRNAEAFRQRGQDMLRRGVDDLLGGIQPQTVHVGIHRPNRPRWRRKLPSLQTQRRFPV